MQDQHSERLVGCFEQVFGHLSRVDIRSATHETVAEWDSVAHVTLLSLIGEEFGVEIDFVEFEEASSFQAIQELMRRKMGSG
jgi:acyl carrier protein